MVSAISTRGVKFKFSEGERILCYEPDPTKTKVLYESKVLDLYVNRDERGRKVPEYLIHFLGWNSSWDRYVREEFILPYTEENCELQTKLAEEAQAALAVKGKHKIKLPPLFKATLAKKQCTEATEPENTDKNESPAGPGSDSDSSDDEAETEIDLDIPEVLKKQLGEDNLYITKKDKLVKLPCKPNVISILEDFVRYFSRKLLCASPPKNSKNGKQLMPEDVENNLNLCKETIDGIRVFFDFTLPGLLLYNQEKKQYQNEAMSCSPVGSSYKWESQESIENVQVKMERQDSEISQEDMKNSTAEKPAVKLELTQGRKSLRSHSAVTSPVLKQDNIPNGEAEIKLPTPEKVKKEDKVKKSTKDRPTLTPTRILRSCEKQKPQLSQTKEDSVPNSPPVSPPPPSAEVDTKRASPVCPTLTISLEPRNFRVTRKSTLQNMSPPRIASPTSPTPSSQTPAESKVLIVSPTPAVPKIGNCISSSNSSSHSTHSNQANNSQFHLVNNEAMLKDILTWRMLPPHLYEAIPAAPSLVYGAQHLLRLFVKLPDLLSRMSLSKRKVPPLLNILNSLLQFLEEKRIELFTSSAYYEISEEQQE